MNDNYSSEECFVCGEPIAVCPCLDNPIPVCVSCAVDILPKAVAHAVLGEHEGGCAMENLEGALKEFERNFWKAAASHLHMESGEHDEPDEGGGGHDEPDGDDSDDDEPGEDGEGPTSWSFAPGGTTASWINN